MSAPETSLEGVNLDQFAISLIERLLKVIAEQRELITKYEGAIEGVKLFMQEFRAKQQQQQPPVS